MPTVSVGRDRLFAAIGETYTEKQFEELCFDFGIELDDVTTEKAIIRKEKHLEEEAGDDEEVIYKIDVAANRYDLLCLEGIAQALRVFIKKEETPTYTLSNVSKESMLRMHVKKETSTVRPYVVCAVLRNITFDEASYNSFIDLQDKLHQNICRRRSLVAIGTHDLDTLQAPFSYEALPPQKINFVPLKQEKNFRADELMEFYKSDLKLKKFLHIIEGSPVYPVIYDHKSMDVPLSYITGLMGTDELKKADEVTSLLNRMQLRAERCPSNTEDQNIRVSVPPTRSDILHPCDVMEDVAIAFGYNKIPKRKLPSLKPLALNELVNLIRVEVVRTSLMPGALKLVGHNKDHPKPIKIFEIDDVTRLDQTKDVGAANRRLLGALYCGTNSGFELIHSLVDRVMEVMATPFKPDGDVSGYCIKRAEEQLHIVILHFRADELMEFYKVNDPNFPGYVEYALSQAIYMLVTENARGVSFRYPPPPFGEGGASSAANCWLNDMNECDKCLNQLLQYVYNCSSYDSGSAYYYNECSLSFWLWTG
ncbi:Phenylalanine--tRNA ligase beta subunit, cytoplasmic [Linum grandiflorum]